MEPQKKSCEDLIVQQCEDHINDLDNIRSLDCEDMEFKDFFKTIEDNGYNWKDYVIIHKNEDRNLGMVERDLDALYELRENIINEYPLSVTKEDNGIKIELSWGGPQDYFMLYDNEATYHYLDWFDGASIILNHYEFEIIEDLWGFLRD
jgi:hypothetical protein